MAAVDLRVGFSFGIVDIGFSGFCAGGGFVFL